MVALASLAGCLSCEPLLEVRNCLDHQCVGSNDAVRLNWTAELASAWPQIDHDMATTLPGEHHHADYTPVREDALWAAFGVTGDEPELIIQNGEQTFRVRVLNCD
jgi:hypothetical protein